MTENRRNQIKIISGNKSQHRHNQTRLQRDDGMNNRKITKELSSNKNETENYTILELQIKQISNQIKTNKSLHK